MMSGTINTLHLLSENIGVTFIFTSFTLWAVLWTHHSDSSSMVRGSTWDKMEKFSAIFKMTQSVLRETIRTKGRGQVNQNTSTQPGERKKCCRTDSLENTGAGVVPQSLCGHIIRSSSVINMVNQCLKKKNLDFSCPVCEEPWSWSEVQAQIQLSQAQYAILETQVNRIIEDLPEIYKKCPLCSSVLRRPMDSAGRLCPFSSCVYCLHTHHFCWSCLAPWAFPNAAGSGQCSNRSCHVVATLLSCETVRDSSSPVVGCPVFRACPRCHTLTLPRQDSKYVVCTECAHRFCYVCLESEVKCAKTDRLDSCNKSRAERQKFVT